MSDRTDFGAYLYQLRTVKGLPLRVVADKLGIDLTLLSKIEHGERQVQGHMLKGIAELFDLDYRALQIEFLNKRIAEEYGKEPFLLDSLLKYLKENGKEMVKDLENIDG